MRLPCWIRNVQICMYPFKELCGCGVGFKLIEALHFRKGYPAASLTPYLDLVATAIAADLVPITGENRILMQYGLQVVNSDPRPGLKALIAGHKKGPLQGFRPGFSIGSPAQCCRKDATRTKGGGPVDRNRFIQGNGIGIPS